MEGEKLKKENSVLDFSRGYTDAGPIKGPSSGDKGFIRGYPNHTEYTEEYPLRGPISPGLKIQLFLLLFFFSLQAGPAKKVY